VAMKEPRLEIMKERGNQPLKGRCSLCRDVKFPPTAELDQRIHQEQRLKYLFNLHFANSNLGTETFDGETAGKAH
jgi:hypothetical protein